MSSVKFERLPFFMLTPRKTSHLHSAEQGLRAAPANLRFGGGLLRERLGSSREGLGTLAPGGSKGPILDHPPPTLLRSQPVPGPSHSAPLGVVPEALPSHPRTLSGGGDGGSGHRQHPSLGSPPLDHVQAPGRGSPHSPGRAEQQPVTCSRPDSTQQGLRPVLRPRPGTGTWASCDPATSDRHWLLPWPGAVPPASQVPLPCCCSGWS